MWNVIISNLVSSAPQDGMIYDVKCWILTFVVNPANELAYSLKLTTYKPISKLTISDIL